MARAASGGESPEVGWWRVRPKAVQISGASPEVGWRRAHDGRCRGVASGGEEDDRKKKGKKIKNEQNSGVHVWEPGRGTLGKGS